MKHCTSAEDKLFKAQFENCLLSPSDFSHRAHLRMAYAYLCEGTANAAYEQMKASLLRFLDHHGIDPTKYHETMTYAWVLAVRHFMEIAEPAQSFDQFIEASPKLSQFPIMLTHYSEQHLYSEQARQFIVEPDLQPIPIYAV